jgi:hypothetical protein
LNASVPPEEPTLESYTTRNDELNMGKQLANKETLC